MYAIERAPKPPTRAMPVPAREGRARATHYHYRELVLAALSSRLPPRRRRLRRGTNWRGSNQLQGVLAVRACRARSPTAEDHGGDHVNPELVDCQVRAERALTGSSCHPTCDDCVARQLGGRCRRLSQNNGLHRGRLRTVDGNFGAASPPGSPLVAMRAAGVCCRLSVRRRVACRGFHPNESLNDTNASMIQVHLRALICCVPFWV